jgi:glycosyltransferase involved in cell wall biosynthesis
LKQKDVILLSTADWDNPFWTNKQHVAVQLAKRGYRVFYLDSLGLRRPSASAQDLKRIFKRFIKTIKGPRNVQENIWVWSPFVVPFQKSAAVRRLNRFLLSQMLKFYVAKIGLRREILWTYNPMTVHLLNLNGFDMIVYHCVDEIKVQPGMPKDILTEAEQQLAKRADVIFTTSKKLTETRKAWNPNTHYFPNVADFEHFAKARDPETIVPGDLAKIPAPRIGFIGAISDYKLDFSLLRFLAKKKPEWSIVLIGKVGEGDPWTETELLDGFVNVHLMGPRPYSELPGYLKGIDVAILPSKLNEYTESMFPMKFFEYLAAGKQVVSINLPALNEYRELVCLAASYPDFVKGIEKALHDDNNEYKKERIAAAEENTYEKRMVKMLALIESMPLREKELL